MLGHRFLSRIITGAAALSLVACTSYHNGHGHKMVVANGDEAIYGSAVDGRTGFASNDINGGHGKISLAEAMKVEKIYFPFDSTEISSSDREILLSQANYLLNNPTATLRIEGHTDERGSREYNIGLGERRAKSVESVFLAAGVNPKQLSTVSYGKQKPDAEGHDEAAWHLNRRAALDYQNKDLG